MRGIPRSCRSRVGAGNHGGNRSTGNFVRVGPETGVETCGIETYGKIVRVMPRLVAVVTFRCFPLAETHPDTYLSMAQNISAMSPCALFPQYKAVFSSFVAAAKSTVAMALSGLSADGRNSQHPTSDVWHCQWFAEKSGFVRFCALSCDCLTLTFADMPSPCRCRGLCHL